MLKQSLVGITAADIFINFSFYEMIFSILQATSLDWDRERLLTALSDILPCVVCCKKGQHCLETMRIQQFHAWETTVAYQSCQFGFLSQVLKFWLF